MYKNVNSSPKNRRLDDITDKHRQKLKPEIQHSALVTQTSSTDCLVVEWPCMAMIHIWCNMIISWWSWNKKDAILIVWWLYNNCVMIVLPLHAGSVMFVGRLFDDCVKSEWWLINQCNDKPSMASISEIRLSLSSPTFAHIRVYSGRLYSFLRPFI